MNSNFSIFLFMLVISGLIWAGMHNNDPSWSGNKNQCIDECYADWKAENGGSIADVERVKQEVLAAASPAALGEKYYGQCVACHGGNGEGGIGY